MVVNESGMLSASHKTGAYSSSSLTSSDTGVFMSIRAQKDRRLRSYRHLVNPKIHLKINQISLFPPSFRTIRLYSHFASCLSPFSVPSFQNHKPDDFFLPLNVIIFPEIRYKYYYFGGCFFKSEPRPALVHLADFCLLTNFVNPKTKFPWDLWKTTPSPFFMPYFLFSTS